ncbi:DEAD/DEAH box helicase, partial [bacterium]|nr:DEAD/DEAH box helicase [bacterium]
MIDFSEVLHKFKNQFANEIVHHRIIAPRQPRNVPFPKSIPPELIDALKIRGIELPYTHQAESWQLLSEGKNVVVITPTASGKTLCYNVP